MDELVGRALGTGGRYGLVGILGRGGMATVFEADDTLLGRRVAIKILKRAASSQGLEARFHQEARTAARLEHPHILPIYDFGEQDGLLYLVMRIVRGESLKQVGPRPQHATDWVLELARQVLSALDYAHERAIVHRDIKPDNILVEQDASQRRGFRAFVADFGIAKALQPEALDAGLTGTGVFVGTPTYMAPEQFAGGPVDGRADLYAFGVVLFELLTGRVPFQGSSVYELADKHRQAPPPLDVIGNSLSADVRRVLARALAKAPEDRYQRGVDLVTELDRAIDRHPTHGQATPTVAESMRPTTSGARPWASNFWVPILAVAIALGILVAGMLARSLANGRIDSSTGSQDVQESSQAEGGATAFAAAPQASARPASSPVPGSVALTDSFDDPANGRLPRTSPRPNDYLLAYEAGEYRMQKVNPQFTTSAIAPIPGEYDDIALAVTVRFVGDLDRRFATLACRIQSGSSSRYAMFFNAGTRMVRLYRYDPGSAPGAPLTEWTRGPDVRPAAQSNRLELSCAGNMIAGRVNDRLVVSASDSTYTVGRVWLSVGTFADNPNMAEARFDDLVVSQARP